MALLADCDKLTFARLRIVDTEREIRSVAKMLYMMYQYSASVTAMLLA